MIGLPTPTASMPYIPDINDLESALKHLHDPEDLRCNPLATLDIVHERVATDQRLSGERMLPLPWIYGYELALLLRSLVDGLDDRGEELGNAEARRGASRPRLYARILKLRFSQGLSWNEVSEEVGRVAGHIQNKLKRPALQMLLGELMHLQAALPAMSPSDERQSFTNLPPQGDFIGRRTAVEEVLAKLRHRRMPIIEICGIGGVGKSELAKRVGWMALGSERLFDAVVWLSAQEAYLSLTRFQTINVSNNIRSLSELLDVTAHVLGSDYTLLELDDKQRHVINALTSGRFPRGVLFIIDNYESLSPTEQHRITAFLCDELPYPCQALITSRYEDHHAQIQSHVMPIQVRLGRMSYEELHACLTHLIQLQQPPLVLTNATIEQLIVAANGIPLALLWLLGQLRYSPHSLSDLLNELQETHRTSPLLGYIFDYSYAMLREHRAARHALHALTIFSHGASLAALAFVLDLSLVETQRAIDLLVQLSLVTLEQTTGEEPNTERYSMLILTRVYTSGKLNETERNSYLLRACHYYCEIEPHNAAARPNILSLLEWARTTEQHQVTIDLFDRLTVGNLIGSPSQVQDCDSYGGAVVTACLALGRAQRADWYTLYAVCWPLVVRRHFVEAQTQLAYLLDRAQQHGWLDNQALACSTLGLLYYDQGDLDDDEEIDTGNQRYETAIRYLDEAAELWRQLDRKDWLAIVLGRIAAIKRSSGDNSGALRYYDEVEALYDALHDKAGKAHTLRRRAHTLLHQYQQQRQSHAKQIAVLLDQALELYIALNDRRGSALTHMHYTILCHLIGDKSRARDHAIQAQIDFASIHDSYNAQRASALAQQMQTGNV